jgi:hypothetical protein
MNVSTLPVLVICHSYASEHQTQCADMFHEETQVKTQNDM